MRDTVGSLASVKFTAFALRSLFAGVAQGIVVVPQQSAWVVERFGKFRDILTPGLHFLVPVMDRIAYVHSLKEMAVAIPNQTAITRDNVTIQIDGVLYVKIVDPQKASYGVRRARVPLFALGWTWRACVRCVCCERRRWRTRCTL